VGMAVRVRMAVTSPRNIVPLIRCDVEINRWPV